MDNTIIIAIVSGLMGTGLYAGLASLIQAFATNKKTKAEAAGIGAKSPAEAESISVGTMKVSLDAANSTILRQEEELKSIRTRLDSIEKTMEEEQEQQRFLRRALSAAHDYISTLLGFIERTVPDAVAPSPQESFDFPPKRN